MPIPMSKINCLQSCSASERTNTWSYWKCIEIRTWITIFIGEKEKNHLLVSGAEMMQKKLLTEILDTEIVKQIN